MPPKVRRAAGAAQGAAERHLLSDGADDFFGSGAKAPAKAVDGRPTSPSQGSAEGSAAAGPGRGPEPQEPPKGGAAAPAADVIGVPTPGAAPSGIGKAAVAEPQEGTRRKEARETPRASETHRTGLRNASSALEALSDPATRTGVPQKPAEVAAAAAAPGGDYSYNTTSYYTITHSHVS